MIDVKAVMKLLSWIVLLTACLSQFFCASRGRPGGGPVDKTPPYLIETEPRPDSTGLDSIEEIIMMFSERMNEPSVEKSIFLSPPLKYETDWSGGDELTMILKDTLSSNQTYVITIGSGAMDMQKNRMTDSFQLAFSTGDILNRGEIYGKVFGVESKDVYYVYAYKNTDPDSLDPKYVKADFLSQTGPDGSFWLRYLPEGFFRVFVIEDLNKNLILDAATERIGIPTGDVVIDSLSGPAGPLNFVLTKIDTTLPEISGIRSINNRSVLLRFSEVVEDFAPEAVSILDTLNGDTLSILGLARNSEEPKQFIIHTINQDSGRAYRIVLPQIADTIGNLQKLPQVADFMASTEEDTTRFDLLKIAPADSASQVSLSSTIGIEFSLPIDTAMSSDGFNLLTEDSLIIEGIWSWKELSQCSFKPNTDFLPDRTYLYNFHTLDLESIWGDTLADTTYTRIFFTISEDEFGSLSGHLEFNEKIEEIVYVQVGGISGKPKRYTAQINNKGEFFIPWILEGQYKLGGFIDIDENGIHSPGSLNPFIFSEPFTIQNDTLRIRKRWELSDMQLSIPGWK